MITAVPCETAVTSPVEETVAILGCNDCQGVAEGVDDPVNITVFPIQAASVPEIDGAEFMLTVKLGEFTIAHPEFCTTALK